MRGVKCKKTTTKRLVLERVNMILCSADVIDMLLKQPEEVYHPAPWVLVVTYCSNCLIL